MANKSVHLIESGQYSSISGQYNLSIREAFTSFKKALASLQRELEENGAIEIEVEVTTIGRNKDWAVYKASYVWISRQGSRVMQRTIITTMPLS